VVIGQAIAQKLYPFVDPVDREIRLDGREYKVIGVFDEKKSAFGSQYDNYILMPVSTFLNTYGASGRVNRVWSSASDAQLAVLTS
jgi:putative ABC transport system permease protein